MFILLTGIFSVQKIRLRKKNIIKTRDKKIGVFPIIAPHEIRAPYYGIFGGGGGEGAIGYLTTKLRERPKYLITSKKMVACNSPLEIFKT